MASLHKPVRASELPGPELSSLEGVPTQPDTSQAAARTRIINFKGLLLELAFRRSHGLRITFDNLCLEDSGVKKPRWSA